MHSNIFTVTLLLHYCSVSLNLADKEMCMGRGECGTYVAVGKEVCMGEGRRW